MASNTLLTIDMITREALVILENNLVFLKHCTRKYEPYFAKTGGKIGEKLRIRKPARYTTTRAEALTIQDTIEEYITLTVDKFFNIGLEFTMSDMALSLQDFSDNILQSPIKQLANDIDSECLKMVKEIYNTVGDTTKLADTLKVYLEAGALLSTQGTPQGDRSVVIGPYTQAGLVDNLKGLFNSVQEVSKQYKEGTMGITGGFKFSMDQNVPKHTCGTGVEDPVLINGAGQTGSTLTVDGLVGTLKKGDTFTISGVYSVNYMNKESTGKLQQFVVLEDVSAGGTSIKISPEIVVTGPRKTVSAGPANDAPLTFIGKDSQILEYGVAFHKDAFAVAFVDLGLPNNVKASRISDSQLGISLRFIEDYDIKTNTNITRIDCLFGCAILRPELACKIISNPLA